MAEEIRSVYQFDFVHDGQKVFRELLSAMANPGQIRKIGEQAGKFKGDYASLLALGCHLCRSCHEGKCNWGIATQRPDLVKRLNPDIGSQRLVNMLTAWNHEIKEMMGGMGINSIESLKGNRLMLRGIGMTEKELEILGIKHAGE